jgi:exodeoxyribonuclease-3
VSLTIASVNVNGIRAAVRKGMLDWISQRQPQVITLQEVRAPDEMVAPLLGEGWHVTHAECGTKGRAGVAIASRIPFIATRSGEGELCFDGTGRWIEADLPTENGTILTVVSAYVHTGDAESPERMREKHAFFDAATARLIELAADGRHLLLTGDLNVAHREVDLKNWKGNLKSAGFLPEERAHFDRWFEELGLVDVARSLAGPGPGPYTWWSYRGKAFDNDAGWRIDYQIASPEWAARAQATWVDRAAEYSQRWSDHAPVVVQYS